jgi:hypothetical protein
VSFSGPSDPTSSTQRHLRRAPVEVLHGGARLYQRIGSVTWLGTIAFGLLGIWLEDWRWFATAVVSGFGWFTSHVVVDLIEAELTRRKTDTPEGD